MSDFAISAAQRQRLLAGTYTPLVFDTKPYVPEQDRGLEPGDRYVLSWRPASVTVLDEATGDIARTPRVPNWFLTVTKVVRRPDGSWLVRFDITDRRDRHLVLRAGGGTPVAETVDPADPAARGYTGGRDLLDAGVAPDAEWLEQHSKMIASKWTRKRFDDFTDVQRQRAHARRLRRAA